MMVRRFIVLYILSLCIVFGGISDVSASSKRRIRVDAKLRSDTSVRTDIRSLQQEQRRQQTITESWSIFQQFVRHSLDTVSMYSFRHPFAEPQKRSALLQATLPWIGTRYGSAIPNQPRRLDCSLFTAMMMKNILGIQLLHGSSSIAAQVQKLSPKDDIHYGDLVFFNGSKSGTKRVGHVGIYLGNGVFVHASIQKGVIFSHWGEDYYKKRYLFAGRISAR
jgi:cell wall-associated NlpC family hydrolase